MNGTSGYELVTDFSLYQRTEEVIQAPTTSKKNKKVFAISILVSTILFIQLFAVGLALGDNNITAYAKTGDSYSDSDLSKDAASFAEMSYYASLDYIKNLNRWRGWANEEMDADADFTLKYDEMSVLVNDGGTEDWHIQFISPKFDVKKNQTYTVKIVFDARYCEDIVVPVRVQESSGEYRTISEQYVNISKLKDNNGNGTGEIIYRYTFTPSDDWEDVEFTIDIGNQGPIKMNITGFEIQEK